MTIRRTPPTSDWNVPAANFAATRILRPRGTFHPAFAASFPDPVPDSSGHITFDIDNDGDGVNDSVWVDLGYPARTDERGQLYKPLFAFLVIGLNGRMPLNTAGNIAGTEIIPRPLIWGIRPASWTLPTPCKTPTEAPFPRSTMRASMSD